MNFDASAYVNVGVWEPDPDDSDLEDDDDQTPGENISRILLFTSFLRKKYISQTTFISSVYKIPFLTQKRK